VSLISGYVLNVLVEILTFDMFSLFLCLRYEIVTMFITVLNFATFLAVITNKILTSENTLLKLMNVANSFLSGFEKVSMLLPVFRMIFFQPYFKT